MNETHPNQASADIAIFGGGIAGLWLLNRLRAEGYSAVLLESDALGGVQTIASQGIIHGGTKYSLSGNLTESARSIGEMPRIWRSCLDGSGELDLRDVRVLSDYQYLWSTGSIGSRMAGFFASKAMRSRMAALPEKELPTSFRSPNFKGRLYRLNEPVLDIYSVVRELSARQIEYCYRVSPGATTFSTEAPGDICIKTDTETLHLRVKKIILTAGAGNAALLNKLGRSQPEMQLRPLHMVILKGQLPAIYGHCLEASTNPRITITSYPSPDGNNIWYVGGQLAEKGTRLDPQTQITAAKRELNAVLPWVDTSRAQWATLHVSRAEPKTPSGQRPESCFVSNDQTIITAWPTKLAFAPRLAAEVITLLQADKLGKTGPSINALRRLPTPPIAQTPWERSIQWN